jgi:hypothetical protein
MLSRTLRLLSLVGSRQSDLLLGLRVGRWAHPDWTVQSREPSRSTSPRGNSTGGDALGAIEPDPGVHALARDLMAPSELGHRDVRLEDVHDCLVPLLHESSSTSTGHATVSVDRSDGEEFTPEANVMHRMDPNWKDSRDHPVMHQVDFHRDGGCNVRGFYTSLKPPLPGPVASAPARWRDSFAWVLDYSGIET